MPPVGDDALQPHAAGVLKHGFAVRGVEMLA
jgi:hypothetical protein